MMNVRISILLSDKDMKALLFHDGPVSRSAPPLEWTPDLIAAVNATAVSLGMTEVRVVNGERVYREPVAGEWLDLTAPVVD